MAKRNGSTALGARALRAAPGARSHAISGEPQSRHSAAVTRPDRAQSTSSKKAPSRSKRVATVITSRRKAPVVRDVPISETSALPPPRIPTPPPPIAPRTMELEWTGDPGGSSPPAEEPHDRWVRRGDELLLKLAAQGASDHEVRADLRDGRFYWVDPRGRVTAEARAELLCTFVPQTASVTMGWAWAEREARGAVARIPGMPAEIDDVGEEEAWHIAMATAEHTSAQYLYRVRSPMQCMFLALSGLTFSPSRDAFVPGTPVAFVLATLREARGATALGAEPVDTLRARIAAAGAALEEQAEYTHRDTDWAFRLVRTGRRLLVLAEQLPRPTFHSVAKGQPTLWLDRKLAGDLIEAIALLEEEWRQFA